MKISAAILLTGLFLFASAHAGENSLSRSQNAESVSDILANAYSQNSSSVTSRNLPSKMTITKPALLKNLNTTSLSGSIGGNQKISLGNEGGHGGDIYASEFVNLGKALQSFLSGSAFNTSIREKNIDLTEFNNDLRSVLVYSRDRQEMILNGEEVDGINFPSRMEIILNRSRWQSAGLKQKLTIVLHEYFGIMNVERDTYEVSSQFSEALDRLTASLERMPNSPQQYYGVCAVAQPLGGDSDCENQAVLQQCAQDKAAFKCHAGKNADCKMIDINVQRIVSEEALGLVTCRATVVAR